MKRLIAFYSGLVLLAGLNISCASTAVEFKWGEVEKIVCRKVKVEGKKKFFILPVYKKQCAKIEKYGWVPEKKYETKGVGVKTDFKERKTEGGSFLPPLPPMKLEN